MSDFGIILVILCCILFHALLSASEMSIISCNRLRMKYLSKKGSIRARIVEYFLLKPKYFLGTVLVGINILVVSSATLTTHLLSKYVSSDFTALLSTVILLPVILLFAEFIPKTLVQKYADTLSLYLAPFLRIVSIILYPLAVIATFFSDGISFLFRGSKKKKSGYSRDELKILIKEFIQMSPHKYHAKKIMPGIFNFVNSTVDKIMVPIQSVRLLSSDDSINQAKKLVTETGFSRLPVCAGKKQDIIGTIHANRLLDASDETEVKKILEKPYYIHYKKYISRVLEEMRSNQKFMAIVINDAEKAIGIVSLEDIMEEVIGDIKDEYDE
ncbi:hemolysin family protein [Chlamydiota bacterium]